MIKNNEMSKRVAAIKALLKKDKTLSPGKIAAKLNLTKEKVKTALVKIDGYSLCDIDTYKANLTKANAADIERVREAIKANPAWGTRRLSRALGMSRDRVSDLLRKAGIELSQATIPVSEDPTKTKISFDPVKTKISFGEREELEQKLSQAKEAENLQKQRAEHWKKQSEMRDSRLNQYEEIWGHVPQDISFKAPILSPKDSVTTPILICSDWHVEEIVEAATINGANEFSMAIADKRISNLATRALKLIKLKRAGTTINDLVIWLGGDFITGHIHADCPATTSCMPPVAIMWVSSRISSLITYMLDEGGFKKIIIPCSVGNHARTTEKTWIAKQATASYEYCLYNFLKMHFADEPRVQFVIASGLHCIVELHNKYKIRFHHGDAIKFNGGIGGIGVPLNKAIMKWDQGNRESYLDIMGHYHTFFPGRRVIINGSLIGYNAYALQIQAPLEPPVQGLAYIESKRGLTSVDPVFLD